MIGNTDSEKREKYVTKDFDVSVSSGSGRVSAEGGDRNKTDDFGVAQFICLCTAAKCTDERNNQGSCDVWNANKKGRRTDGEKVLSNLREMTEKTVLIVTHRKAALEICDMELRFSEGSIREIP